MMMMTELAGEKRRDEEAFLLSCEGGGGRISISSGGGRGCSAASNKRLKTTTGGGGGGGGGAKSIKEKKDKIGERVAELQQLVSPFGKTDTASVLQEATGYIKFLHEQLQVLSSPYLRSTPTIGTLQEAEYYNLRSRDLCLMPVACTLKIARSNGADIWAPINTTSPKF